MRADVMGLVQEVFGVEPGVSSGRDHTAAVWFWKRQAVEFFKRHGYPEGRKSLTVSIPRIIFLSSSRIQRAFLKDCSVRTAASIGKANRANVG
jgi:hypothetical protein